jgi:hypothetical protein
MEFELVHIPYLDPPLVPEYLDPPTAQQYLFLISGLYCTIVLSSTMKSADACTIGLLKYFAVLIAVPFLEVVPAV